MTTSASYPSLQGQCIFITGGATGIGAALVRAFAQQGANVAFVDIDVDSAKQLINELESEQGPKLWYQATDVTNVQALQPFWMPMPSWVRWACWLITQRMICATPQRMSLHKVGAIVWPLT